MEDSPNEVQNINNPTKIEEVDEPKTLEELQKEVDLLKAENTKTKRNLMWKVRKLEKDKILTENEKIRLERELKSLRVEGKIQITSTYIGYHYWNHRWFQNDCKK